MCELYPVPEPDLFSEPYSMPEQQACQGHIPEPLNRLRWLNPVDICVLIVVGAMFLCLYHDRPLKNVGGWSISDARAILAVPCHIACHIAPCPPLGGHTF